jgi:hypothetical protein
MHPCADEIAYTLVSVIWLLVFLMLTVWVCHHVCLYVYTLHQHCVALGTIRALLEPVADGPEKGRIGWSVEVLYAVRAAWLERWMVAPKRAVLCTANFSGPLGQQQAGFGGQRAGSRPS